MKRLILVILSISSILFLQAQEKVLELSLSDLNGQGVIKLRDNDYWLFHSGNDSSFSDLDIDTKDWEQLTPTQITKDLADENNRIEGWFRLKIKIDKDLSAKINYLYISNYGQAIDLYVNSKKLQSVGNIGSGDDPYIRSSNPNEPIPFDFTPDTIITLALHYVCESPGPFAFRLMNTNSFGFGVFVSNQEFVDLRKSRYEREPYNQFFVVTVCFVLSLLFTVLYFQNRKEKSFGHIVIISWLFFISALGSLLEQGYNIPKIGYDGVLYINRFQGVFASSILYYSVIIFSTAFTQKRPKRHGLVLLIFSLLVLEFAFIRNEILAGSLLLIILGINTSYILKHYRNATKAQWSIIIGFLVIIISVLSFFIIFILTGQNTYFVFFIFYLSFPLSLVFYVSFRFKEIILEVRNNANQVIALTEEKRQQALHQKEILEQQVEKRTKELSESLENLKSTQTQLIHSEKMASLGELTAGIAHEIQNPLNFVNNFSDLNKGLLEELKDAVAQNDQEEVAAIIKDLAENEGKINHHGRRAEEIVRSMLQHSRTGTGEKELTDINALADEYLRLAYHGLRAKDKSFNADFKTKLDPELPKIKVVPQDIGRVLLNLINNAFQAVRDVENPEVIVTTEMDTEWILVTVKDNGSGIPEDIKEKIFQPFFTTKATGEGTGLGLSMSYDIVVKGHGGELSFTSSPKNGTEFIIQLPPK